MTGLYPAETFLSPQEMEAKENRTEQEEQMLSDWKLNRVFWEEAQATLWGASYKVWNKFGY